MSLHLTTYVEGLLALKRAGLITSYHDLAANHHGHQLGGWPLFCQPGIGFSPAFEFILQLAFDAKTQLTIVGSGTIFWPKMRLPENGNSTAIFIDTLSLNKQTI